MSAESIKILTDRIPHYAAKLTAEDAAWQADQSTPRKWRVFLGGAWGEHQARLVLGLASTPPAPSTPPVFDRDKWRRILACAWRVQPEGCGCTRCAARPGPDGLATPVTGNDCLRCPVADGGPVEPPRPIQGGLAGPAPAP